MADLNRIISDMQRYITDETENRYFASVIPGNVNHLWIRYDHLSKIDGVQDGFPI